MSKVTEHAALADALLGWASELGDDIWFTPEEAAAAVGADAARVREALAVLEAEGLVYRGITSDAWCVTADGKERFEEAPR